MLLPKEEVNRYIDIARNKSTSIQDYRGELEYLLTRIPDATESVIDIIKGKGYDGVKYPASTRDGGIGYNYAIYNTVKLKKANRTTSEGGK